MYMHRRRYYVPKDEMIRHYGTTMMRYTEEDIQDELDDLIKEEE